MKRGLGELEFFSLEQRYFRIDITSVPKQITDHQGDEAGLFSAVQARALKANGQTQKCEMHAEPTRRTFSPSGQLGISTG